HRLRAHQHDRAELPPRDGAGARARQLGHHRAARAARSGTVKRETLIEVAIVFAIATGAASLLYNVGQSVGFIRNHLHPLVALVFLVLPQVVLRKRGNIERYGFTTHPLGLGLLIAGIAVVVVLPLFSAGFWLTLRLACAHAASLVPGSCW